MIGLISDRASSLVPHVQVLERLYRHPSDCLRTSLISRDWIESMADLGYHMRLITQEPFSHVVALHQAFVTHPKVQEWDAAHKPSH